MMNKARILLLKRVYELNQLSLQEVFEIACEDAYRVRADSKVAPIAQCRIRAQDLAFPLTALWLDMEELLKRCDRNG